MVFLFVHAHQPVMRNQYPLPQPSSAQPKVINHQHTQHLPSAHSFETVPTNMPYKDDGLGKSGTPILGVRKIGRP